MNRHLRHIYLVCSLIIGIVAVAWLAVAGSHDSAVDSAACGHRGKMQRVIIEDNHVSPENTYAKMCDRLIFVNRDNVTRLISFGSHEHHVPYDGVSERILSKNASFTITLVQTGLFHFHDHFHDEVSGYFSVEQ